MSAAAPLLRVPPRATDTHMHVVEPGYPLAASAQAVPPAAPLSAYLPVRARLGLERCVVVQPSAYGTDNACTLAAVAALGGAARGVATVDAGTGDAELARLSAGGIRGARLHMLAGGIIPWGDVEPICRRIAAHGWHAQLQLDGRQLPEHAALLARLPCTLVIDHTGKFLEPVAPSHAGFRALLRLVEAGRTYVKLSAPYETSRTGPPAYEDVGALARALVAAAPERMLWASNWPHIGQPREGGPDEAVLLDTLLDWAPREADRQLILADNPARLYGF